jgi:hypothetical protein
MGNPSNAMTAEQKRLAALAGIERNKSLPAVTRDQGPAWQIGEVFPGSLWRMVFSCQQLLSKSTWVRPVRDLSLFSTAVR